MYITIPIVRTLERWRNAPDAIYATQSERASAGRERSDRACSYASDAAVPHVRAARDATMTPERSRPFWILCLGFGAGVMVASRAARTDRKSTRLNSSHTVISYAVFCLKKKKNTQIIENTTQLH